MGARAQSAGDQGSGCGRTRATAAAAPLPEGPLGSWQRDGREAPQGRGTQAGTCSAPADSETRQLTQPLARRLLTWEGAGREPGRAVGHCGPGCGACPRPTGTGQEPDLPSLWSQWGPTGADGDAGPQGPQGVAWGRKGGLRRPLPPAWVGGGWGLSGAFGPLQGHTEPQREEGPLGRGCSQGRGWGGGMSEPHFGSRGPALVSTTGPLGHPVPRRDLGP